MSNEQPERGKSLIIRGLVPGLTERGKIKIGEKGRMITSKSGKQFQPPTKLDYFRVTTLLRGLDDNYVTDAEVHQKHGEKPKTLPVRLLYDQIELNFQCRYVCFVGKQMWCAGDGEAAFRVMKGDGSRAEVACPCGRQAPDYVPTNDRDPRCKINGCLSVIIDGVDRVGGVWKFRTTSYNSVVGILSSLTLIKRITGGPLAGIPLNLTLNPKTVITPTDGRAMNVWVVGLEYAGSVQQLQDIGYQQLLADTSHYQRIARIEEEARRLIAHDPIRMDDESHADIAAEFYPEEFQKGETIDVTATPSTPAEPVTTGESRPEQETVTTAEVVEVAPVTTEPVTGPDNSQPGAEPTVTKSDMQDKPRRRRTQSFDVDPQLFNGIGRIVSCGVTPEQLLQLKTAAKEPVLRAAIAEALKAIGYQELSYLRFDEAEVLLKDILPLVRVEATETGEPPAQQHVDLPPAQTVANSMVIPDEFAADETAEVQPEEKPTLAEDLLQCPYDGEWRSKSQHCMVHCHMRLKDSWCPACGDDPPADVNLFGGGAA